MQTIENSSLSERRRIDEDEESLYEYVKVVLKHHRIMSYIIGVCFILSIIVSLLLPKMYEATARVLSPRETGGGIAALVSSGDETFGNMATNFLSNSSTAAQYVGILKSRTVGDALIQKFDLKKHYGLEYSQDVIKELARRSTIVISKKDQIISISVESRDPSRAADMANYYVEMLDNINRKLSATQGRRKRIFLEERLKEVRGDLGQAELNLKLFQEKYHLVAIEEQAKAAIEGAAELKGQIIAAKTELKVFMRFGTEKQTEVMMLRAKIEELEKQLNAIEGGADSDIEEPKAKNNDSETNYYIPFRQLPELGMKLMRYTREAKLQEKLFELLTSQYEMAQIEEAKDVDTVQLLDKAKPPERKSSPNRMNIVLASTILSVFLSIFYAFFYEFVTEKFNS